MIDEIWLPVAEFPHYVISNYGNVKRRDRDENRKITVNPKGFPVMLMSGTEGPTRYLRQVNKLVALTFLEPPRFQDETSVWHIDGNLLNCYSGNLKWERLDRVREWNEMHRINSPKFKTPPVRNNRTGSEYANAFECAMAEGKLESYVVARVERQASHIYDETARYCYIPR